MCGGNSRVPICDMRKRIPGFRPFPRLFGSFACNICMWLASLARVRPCRRGDVVPLSIFVC
jgi:hypothetical protein